MRIVITGRNDKGNAMPKYWTASRLHADASRDLAHEHDMEILRREQLRADCDGEMADDETPDSYDHWPDPSDDEYCMGDPDEWDGE
jgi:hypothetical protein